MEYCDQLIFKFRLAYTWEMLVEPNLTPTVASLFPTFKPTALSVLLSHLLRSPNHVL